MFEINFLEWNLNNDFYGKTALHIAVERENVEIVVLLLLNDYIDINLLSILILIKLCDF